MTRITWKEAERLTGFRRDRRNAYAVQGGRVFVSVMWRAGCTGCTETPEMTAAPERGTGCRECGWTGVRRHAAWEPLIGREVRNG